MQSPADALPKAGGCISQGRCSPKAQGCSPPGWAAHSPRDALPGEFSLPTTAAQSSGCQLRGLGGFVSRVPPRGAAGQRGREATLGWRGWPRSPACCQPSSQRTPRLPPPLAHAFGCSCPPPPEPRQLLPETSLPAAAAPSDPSIVSRPPGIRRLHWRCQGWVAAPSPPARVLTPGCRPRADEGGTSGSVWGREAIGG